MEAPAGSDVAAFLESERAKPLVRFIVCGSVDDGKSTLIGRMLYDSKRIFDDQLRALETESRQYGTQGERIDLALVMDGLQAEREQGITIDVAYRFFSTDRRKFIVADAPGHEQYTRNMATGASTAELAVILVDACKGVLQQTRRHTRIVSMMGITRLVLAVNKMDLVGYDCASFERIKAEFESFASECGIKRVTAIPISALEGGNVVERAARMSWYDGPSLMEHLDTVPFAEAPNAGYFCMPVQSVSRPDPDFRGFCGRVASGMVRPGDRVRALPSGIETRVKALVAWDGPQQAAQEGQSVTLTLTEQLDVSRGDAIVGVDAPVQTADQFEAKLLWMSTHHLLPGRPYLLKMHYKEVTATVLGVRHREDVNTGTKLSAKTLELNEIGVIQLSTSELVVFDSYASNRTMGGFILIDKLTFETVGAGMIHFALRRASNIHWQALEITKEARAALKRQRPRCIWFTGLSGSGKSTLASLLERRLHVEGLHTYVLDGDNVRHGLNRDLGFTDIDRVENIRRVAEVAKLMVDAGLIVLVSFISPFRAERRLARGLFGKDEFIEVYVDTPIEECERRDPKGLYAKARRGELKNFTGIDSEYEPPEAAEISLRTVDHAPNECVEMILSRLGHPTG
jgi:bifunctional enzyme CysN/CysC